MRRSLTLGLLATFATSILACTAILGNFTVGDVPGGGDSGKDGPGGDALQTDGGPDAIAPPSPMKCDTNGGPTTITNDPNLDGPVFVHSLPGNPPHFRVVSGDKNRQYPTSHTVDDKFGNDVFRNIKGFTGSFSLAGVFSYDGGFIALALADLLGSPRLEAIRFDDNAADPLRTR